jgi:hypothetical protein
MASGIDGSPPSKTCTSGAVKSERRPGDIISRSVIPYDSHKRPIIGSKETYYEKTWRNHLAESAREGPCLLLHLVIQLPA